MQGREKSIAVLTQDLRLLLGIVDLVFVFLNQAVCKVDHAGDGVSFQL